MPLSVCDFNRTNFRYMTSQLWKVFMVVTGKWEFLLSWEGTKVLDTWLAVVSFTHHKCSKGKLSPEMIKGYGSWHPLKGSPQSLSWYFALHTSGTWPVWLHSSFELKGKENIVTLKLIFFLLKIIRCQLSAWNFLLIKTQFLFNIKIYF